jgi:hypothetical protein
MARARESASSASVLLSAVERLLAETAEAVAVAATEIRSLRIDCIDLPWPERPRDGMIYFTGTGTGERLWRCDYIGASLRALGCDDGCCQKAVAAHHLAVATSCSIGAPARRRAGG